MQLKISAVSDLHGHLPNIDKDTDLLLLAGDICCHGNETKQANWADTKLRVWLEDLDRHGIKVIACAGNHDWLFYTDPQDYQKELSDLKFKYLEDSCTIYNNLKIYGTPWTKKFFDWAFMLDDEVQLYYKWKDITECDFLICHSPPYMIGDRTSRTGEYVGSISLRTRIETICPSLVVFGHIHEGRGIYTHYQGDKKIVYANATLVNEKYEPVYRPYTFIYDTKTKDLTYKYVPGE